VIRLNVFGRHFLWGECDKNGRNLIKLGRAYRWYCCAVFQARGWVGLLSLGCGSFA